LTEDKFTLREDEQKVDPGQGVQVACDQCGMIGPMTRFTQGIDDDRGTIHFQVLEMEECGHGFVVSVKDDDLVGPVLEKVEKLTKRAMMLQGSGDQAGLERTVKKIQAAQIEVQQKMRRLWTDRAGKLSEWPATPRLAGSDDS